MYRGELRLQDGENLLWQCSPRPEPSKVKNKKVLSTLVVLWLIMAGYFLLSRDVTGAVVPIVLGSLGLLLSRWQMSKAELVEYFVTDQRIVVHSDEQGKFAERVYPMGELPEPTLEMHDDGTGTITFAGAEDRRRRRTIRVDGHAERDLKLRAINHAQRVFAHVQRARHSAPDTPAE